MRRIHVSLWLAQTAIAGIALFLFVFGLRRYAPELGWSISLFAVTLILAVLATSALAGKAISRGVGETTDRAIDQKSSELSSVIDKQKSEVDLRDHILGSMTEAVILAGNNGEVIYANASAARLFGRNQLSSVPAQLSRAEGEADIHHPERRTVQYASVAIKEGRTLYVVQDVTEARRVEATRRDFVANASHELKTPVAAILATSETLRDAVLSDPAKVQSFSDTLVNEAGRLSQLVQDLLDLAHLERGEELTGLVTLGSLVIKETEAIRERAMAKGLSLRVEVDERLGVMGSEKDLILMVRNLFDNAVSYTQEGSIQVSLAREGDDVVLEVTDTGVGIPAVDLGRVFERFYRVDKARSRDTGGTGLGLSIVRHIAETHGGRVSVKSELGVGSTFQVVLPSS